ncbi:MAG: SDR family NAD(P)-dependent oxidoreductase, partial [Planctomycetota bacterium]
MAAGWSSDLNGEAAAAIGGRDRAVACRVDITDAASVRALADATLAAFGRADILVNNAGVLKSHFIAEFPVEDWDLVLNVNLRGAFLCMREFARIFAAQKSGSIININSDFLIPVGWTDGFPERVWRIFRVTNGLRRLSFLGSDFRMIGHAPD